MEILVLQSRTHNIMSHQHPQHNNTIVSQTNFTTELSPSVKSKTMSVAATPASAFNVNTTTLKFSRNNYSYENTTISTISWNNSVYNNSLTNASDYDYDFQMFINGTADGGGASSWTLCKDWTPAQHPLFQTANFFFAAAFLVPGSFKQSVLIVRWV